MRTIRYRGCTRTNIVTTITLVVQPRVPVDRFGSAKQVLPMHLQVAHPSLSYAAMMNSRFVAGRSGGPRGGGGGGGDNAAKGEGEDDAVMTLIDKYGDTITQLSFSGALGFASG